MQARAGTGVLSSHRLSSVVLDRRLSAKSADFFFFKETSCNKPEPSKSMNLKQGIKLRPAPQTEI